jgi:phenylpropionate dioxygenase-like ring-hydroxylating dioxygenase large terminal subunit
MYTGFPYKTYPTGWFQVGWSADFAKTEAKPLRYFGKDLVGYRGGSGSVHIMDAHCPHLGAHLGYGGTVVGEDIVCPFHGWRWDAAGQNVDIPYSAKIERARRLACWQVRESSGIVWLWHSADGQAPNWEPPAVP